jgi:hypothetical protein
MPDPGLRSEMNYVREPVLGKQRRYAAAVFEVELLEAEGVAAGEFGEARLLQRGIVIGVEIIDTDDAATAFRQPPAAARRGNR